MMTMVVAANFGCSLSARHFADEKIEAPRDLATYKKDFPVADSLCAGSLSTGSTTKHYYSLLTLKVNRIHGAIKIKLSIIDM